MATRLECALLEGDALAAWDALVERAPLGTLFHSYRWTALLAEAFGRTARVLGVFRNGELVAGSPLYERRVPGLVISNPPIVAGYAGALLGLPEYDRACRTNSEVEQVLDALEAGVRERYGYARLTHPPGVVDARPFLWHGWNVTPRYTFRMELRDPNDVFDAFEPDTRRKIRRAEEAGLVVSRIARTSEIIGAYESSYRRHEEPPPVPVSMLARLADRLIVDGLARGYVVRDEAGNAHAFQMQVLDSRVAYGWIAGMVPEHTPRAGFSLLTWRILSELAQTHRLYDFLGANTPTIAQFKRAFGGDLVPYWETRYATGLARVMFAVRGLARR